MVESMANGDIRVVDIAKRSHRTLEHQVVDPKKLAISHDGAVLVVLCMPTESKDRIDVINLKTGTLLQSITRSFDHEDDDIRNDYWRGFALNHDGSQLATGRWEQLTVWNTASAKAEWTIRSQPDASNSGNAGILSFSGDGKWLACGECVRDAADGKVAAEFPLLRTPELAANRSAASGAQLNADGSLLALSTGRTLRVVDVRTEKELWHANSPFGEYFSSIRFAPDGETVVAGCGNEILMWDAASGDQRGPAIDRIRSMAINPVEEQLLLGTNAGYIQAVHTATFETTHTDEAHQRPVEAIVFNAEGTAAASTAADSVVLHNPIDHSSRSVLENNGFSMRSRTPGLTPLAFSDGGTQLYSFPYRPARSRNQLLRIAADSGKQLPPLQTTDMVLSIYGLESAGHNELLMLSPKHRGVVSVWNSQTGEHISNFSRALPKFGGRVKVAVSRDGKRVACGVRAEVFRLHDRTTDSFVDLKKGHRSASLRAIEFSPNGNVLASAGEDGRITLWNTTTGKVIQKIKAGPNAGIIRDLNWTFDGSKLAALNGNGTVTLHEVANVQFIAEK